MEETEKAVLCLYSQASDPGIRKQANQYCESLRQQEGSWRHVCGLFLHTKIPEVQFWCLQTLHEVMQYRVAVLAPEDLAELRGFLVALVTEKLPTAQFPVFIVNKIAQIYAALLRNEYPETWPDAVTVILGALNSGLAMIDVFLRILEAMDTDIISAEFHRSPADAAVSMRVKDALREQCIADVVSACFTILESYHASQPALGQMCLSVLARYIPWMDIGLVMNDKFVPAFYALLGRDDMVVQAAGCLTEMVLKKMEPAPKVLLLSNLVNKGIVEETLRAQQQRGQVGSEGMAAMAALVAAVCKELLVAGEKLAGSGGAEEASASALLGEMMPLLLSCASSDQDGVSIATMDFLTSYVNMLKRATRVAPEQVAQLAPILGVLQLKLTYPAEFDFENPGEAEEEFLEFRRDLSVLLKNIARISPDAAIAYVQRAIGTVLARLWEPQTPFGEVECVLTMLYELGEVIRLDEAPANPEVSMAAALAMVMSSNLGQYRHHSVQRAYLEIAHRYAKFLQMQQQHIPGVLQSFVQVVTSGSKLVRSKSCYNFLKVLRAIRGNLAVHVDALMEALLPHLVSTSLGDLEHQDRLYLFEAAGNILAADGLPPQDSARHLARVVTPLVERMEAVAERYVASGQSQGGAGAVALDGLGSDDFLNANIGVSLECIGWLSKGCPSLWQVPSSSEQLHRVLCVSTGVLSLLPSSGRLRSSALVYLHRMVDCLGTGMLPALPPALSHMLTSSGDDPKGITEVVTLVNQMLSKFKAGCEGLMLAIMPQLARAVLHNVNSNTALLRNQMSQEGREYRELYKIWLQLLQTAGIVSMLHVLAAADNGSMLQPTVESAVDGMVLLDEASACKVAVGIVVRMANKWAVDGEGALPGFRAFLLPIVVRSMFQCALAPNVNPNDAQSHSLLSDIAAMQASLRQVLRHPELTHFPCADPPRRPLHGAHHVTRGGQACGKEWDATLSKHLIDTLALEPHIVQAYLYALANASEREFREVFIAQVSQLR